MLEYTIFCMELERRLRKRVDQSVTINRGTYNTVNQTHDALMLAQGNLSTCIRLKEVFNDYKQQKKTYNQICDDAIKALYDLSISPFADQLYDKDFILNNVIVQLVSRKGNEELLNLCPYNELLDLAYVYRVVFCNEDTQISSLITWGICNRFGINQEELHVKGLANIRSKGGEPHLEDFGSLMGRLMGQKEMGFDLGPLDSMYLLTNTACHYGAYLLGDRSALSYAHDIINDDFYILPSSIHELLLLPVAWGAADDLKEVVKEVNNTTVSPGDRLSYEVYLYDGIETKIVAIE